MFTIFPQPSVIWQKQPTQTFIRKNNEVENRHDDMSLAFGEREVRLN